MKTLQTKHPLTFDPADVQPSSLDGPPAVLWAARLDLVQKRYLDPVEIMAEVVKRIPDAKLYLVGSGFKGNLDLNALNSRIAELGLEETVIPCGYQMDMASWYRTVSVFLLTSSREAFCLGLAEALTFGLPVVMYDLPYLTLVQGNAGIVSVPQLDIKAAADAICELLENREYRLEVGRRGREFIEKLYAGDEIAEQWRRIFDSVGEPVAMPEEPSAEPEVYRENLQLKEIVRLLVKQYKLRLPVPSGSGGKAGNAPLKFIYGDKAKQQYAELRTTGTGDKHAVSLVTQQDGKTRFNVLLNSDGNRNWVTPEELKTITKRSEVAPLAKQLQAHKVTLEEMRKAFTVQAGGRPCVRFPYGDAANQQYAELRTTGTGDKHAVSLVTQQQDGKKQPNVLLKSDGTRNWVTPEELKRLTKRSDASEMELEAKVEELTEQLKQLQARYADLSERRKVRPRQVKVKIYRWKKK